MKPNISSVSNQINLEFAIEIVREKYFHTRAIAVHLEHQLNLQEELRVIDMPEEDLRAQIEAMNEVADKVNGALQTLRSIHQTNL